MQIIDNVNLTVKGDLQKVIRNGSKVSVAAACFSIYAYQELKKQLEGIKELRFFLLPRHLLLRNPRKHSESSIFLVFPESAVCTVRSLK